MSSSLVPPTSRGAPSALQRVTQDPPPPLPPFEIAPDDPRIPPLAGELAARFGRHCDAMPPETFERLVRRAAWIRLRWP